MPPLACSRCSRAAAGGADAAPRRRGRCCRPARPCPRRRLAPAGRAARSRGASSATRLHADRVQGVTPPHRTPPAGPPPRAASSSAARTRHASTAIIATAPTSDVRPGPGVPDQCRAVALDPGPPAAPRPATARLTIVDLGQRPPRGRRQRTGQFRQRRGRHRGRADDPRRGHQPRALRQLAVLRRRPPGPAAARPPRPPRLAARGTAAIIRSASARRIATAISRACPHRGRPRATPPARAAAPPAAGGGQPRPGGRQAAQLERCRRRIAGQPSQVIVDVGGLDRREQHAQHDDALPGLPAGEHPQVPHHGRDDRALRLGQFLPGADVVPVRGIGQSRDGRVNRRVAASARAAARPRRRRVIARARTLPATQPALMAGPAVARRR